MKHSAPHAHGPAAPLWRAAAAQRLLLPYCNACERYRWPARASCPQCREALQWREASGRGRIEAYSVVRRAASPELAQAVPYVVAFVALEEGVRLFSHIVDIAPQDLRTGMPVRCRFEPSLDPALAVPVFAPVAAPDSKP
jgi:uncharacterized OB-fold protein